MLSLPLLRRAERCGQGKGGKHHISPLGCPAPSVPPCSPPLQEHPHSVPLSSPPLQEHSHSVPPCSPLQEHPSPPPLQEHPHAGLRRPRCSTACCPKAAVLHLQQGVAGVAEVELGGGEQHQQGFKCGEGGDGRRRQGRAGAGDWRGWRYSCWSEGFVEEIGQGEDEGGDGATTDHAGR